MIYFEGDINLNKLRNTIMNRTNQFHDMPTYIVVLLLLT